jgi:pilus assembly protein CpaC
LQVNLQVRFAEVSRTKSLSSRPNTIDPTSGMKFGVGQGGTVTSGTGSLQARSAWASHPHLGWTRPPRPQQDHRHRVSNSSTATTLAMAGKLFGMNILAALDAAENIGLATTLAQPNLTALSGETGEFLAGGEFPIPISSTLGTVSIEFKRLWRLAQLHTHGAGRRAHSLRVRPEGSELTSDGAVTLNGYTIPALTTRRAETSVELGSGRAS